MDLCTAVQNNWVQMLAVLGAVVIAAQALVASLRPVIGGLRWLASKTSTDRDDQVVSKLGAALEVVASGLETVRAYLRSVAVYGRGKP